ncbi:unnamed protein product, partial [Ectocarpus sp. 4 AP-2014]
PTAPQHITLQSTSHTCRQMTMTLSLSDRSGLWPRRRRRRSSCGRDRRRRGARAGSGERRGRGCARAVPHSHPSKDHAVPLFRCDLLAAEVLRQDLGRASELRVHPQRSRRRNVRPGRVRGHVAVLGTSSRSRGCSQVVVLCHGCRRHSASHDPASRGPLRCGVDLDPVHYHHPWDREVRADAGDLLDKVPDSGVGKHERCYAPRRLIGTRTGGGVVRQLGSGRPLAGVRADHDHHRHRCGHDSRRNGRATTGRRQLGPQRTGQINVCSPQRGAVSRSLWC